MMALLSLALLAQSVFCSTLSAVDFTSYSTSSEYSVSRNPIGLSSELPTMLPLFANSLFKEYLINSNLYGYWSANFVQAIHSPLGYIYNCTKQDDFSPNTTYACVYDIDNDTMLKEMGSFFWDTCNYFGSSVGWDMQLANFSSTDYIREVFYPFMVELRIASRQPFNVELVDRGDRFAELGVRANYSAKQFVQDCNYVNNYMYGVYMIGPGTTAAADSSWYAENRDIYYYCGFFTFRVVAFPNASELTIANLLSETYTSQLLTKRLNVGGVSYLGDLVDYLGSINDVRLVEDEIGVDGLTNSFAASIWAIEIALEFFYLCGYQLQFFSPMRNGSFQNVLGPPPTFTPTILYSALMLIDLAVMNYPYIDKAVVSPGLSDSIKIYGLDYYYNYGLLILNKDMNASRSGEVKVMIKDLSGLYCIYFQADSLSATAGATLGGVSFIGNHSAPVGSYAEHFFAADESGYYHVALNYSQVAYCYTKVQENFVYFPQGRRSAAPHLRLAALLLLLLALWL